MIESRFSNNINRSPGLRGVCMSRRKGKHHEKHQAFPVESMKRFSIVILILFILFIISGGLYQVIENPQSLTRDQSGQPTFIYPSPSDQTSTEFVLTFILFGMTLVGGLLIYNGSQVLYRKQSANTQLALGILLFTIGLMILLIMTHIKDPQFW